LVRRIQAVRGPKGIQYLGSVALPIANAYEAAGRFRAYVDQLVRARTPRDQLAAITRAEVWLLDELVPTARGLRGRIGRALDEVTTKTRSRKTSQSRRVLKGYG